MNMNKFESHETRIANLEITIAHQQRDYDTLNLVVTEYADQIDRLRRTVQRLTQRLAAMEASVGEVNRVASSGENSLSSSLEEERPPHY